MLKIRLTRLGDKHAPQYRVVVTDSRAARDAAYIENLGTYNTLVNPAEIKINVEKAKEWLGKGATPTDTARSVLVRAGAIEKKTQPKNRKPSVGKVAKKQK